MKIPVKFLIMNSLSIMRALFIGLLHFTLLLSQKEKIDEIDRFLIKSQKQFDVPGVSISIVKDGRIIFSKGYGVRSLSKGIAVDENSIYAIGSTTKAFTSAALGQLVDAGTISWDDRVIDHIPEFELQFILNYYF